MDPTEIHLDAEVLQASLNRRIQARVARADSAVEISGETLRRWAEEELESLVRELAFAHFVARPVLN
jgi:hypothetical protein